MMRHHFHCCFQAVRTRPSFFRPSTYFLSFIFVAPCLAHRDVDRPWLSFFPVTRYFPAALPQSLFLHQGRPNSSLGEGCFRQHRFFSTFFVYPLFDTLIIDDRIIWFQEHWWASGLPWTFCCLLQAQSLSRSRLYGVDLISSWIWSYLMRTLLVSPPSLFPFGLCSENLQLVSYWRSPSS